MPEQITLAPVTWVAFAHHKRIAYGPPKTVATDVKKHLAQKPNETVLIFDACTSRHVDLDLHGSLASVLSQINAQMSNEIEPDEETDAPSAHGPGRPKLGVIAREVTLLPRHWAWLAAQPGGASVALRKLVEQAQRKSKAVDLVREGIEATYRFMHGIAGDELGFEEASRALFAKDLIKFRHCVAKWPHDVRTHLLALAEAALS